MQYPDVRALRAVAARRYPRPAPPPDRVEDYRRPPRRRRPPQRRHPARRAA